MGEQATLEFDLHFGDVLLHKLVYSFKFNIFTYVAHIFNQSELIQTHCFYLSFLGVLAVLRYESSKYNNFYNR